VVRLAAAGGLTLRILSVIDLEAIDCNSYHDERFAAVWLYQSIKYKIPLNSAPQSGAVFYIPTSLLSNY
jgi:hypothetical protein